MYLLQDVKAKLFLNALLLLLPKGSKISLEGELTAQLKPVIPFSTEEEGIFRRNTLAPTRDFWVFEIDKTTLPALRGDVLNRIGIRKHVLHIHIGCEEELIFASYDKFGEDHVVFKPGFGIGLDFLKEMKQKGVIGGYKAL